MMRIYTDGAARGNPGPAGWGAVLINDTLQVVHEIGGQSVYATNNQMELSAALEAIIYFKKNSTTRECVLYTDSSYVINGMKKWVHIWQKNEWHTSTNNPVVNVSLWQSLVKQVEEIQIEWLYVPGHAGVPLNERADMIATRFADNIHIDLFHGSLNQYPFDASVSQNKLSAKKAGAVKKRSTQNGYYVVVTQNEVARYETWEECEKQVKGVKGVRYKKVVNQEEENQFIKKYKV